MVNNYQSLFCKEGSAPSKILATKLLIAFQCCLLVAYGARQRIIRDSVPGSELSAYTSAHQSSHLRRDFPYHAQGPSTVTVAYFDSSDRG